MDRLNDNHPGFCLICGEQLQDNGLCPDRFTHYKRKKPKDTLDKLIEECKSMSADIDRMTTDVKMKSQILTNLNK